MKKVLIITPNFPPVAYPDMHRVRMALPFLRDFGWEPLILKTDPAEQVGVKDSLLCATVPDDIKVWQAGCIPKLLTEWLGLRHVGLRSMFHMALMGSSIIRSERPDLVFFSTTMFPLFSLGPYWLRKHQVPYILDFQDPWLSERPAPTARSKSSMKRRVSDYMAGVMEPGAVRKAAHIVCVSPAYPEMLNGRYPDVPANRFTVLPFGASETDFEVVDRLDVRQSVFDPNDGFVHWVYVGRGGTDMAFSLRGFFGALRRARATNPAGTHNIRLHFVGTDYAAGSEARKSIQPIAEEYGVADFVCEYPQRIPYFAALKCLRDADALIVPGSDDPGYTASKLYPYILAKKPMLAIFHERSSVVRILATTRAGTVVSFNDRDTSEGLSTRIYEQWFCSEWESAPSTQWSEFHPYTAREMTNRLCNSFDEVFSAPSSTPC